MNDGDQFFGRMYDPTAAAFLKGICGDEMEFYLYIRGGRSIVARIRPKDEEDEPEKQPFNQEDKTCQTH